MPSKPGAITGAILSAVSHLTMNPIPRRPIMLIVFCAVLSACGQTGPLYLPDQMPESEKPPSQRNKERAQGKQNTQPAPPDTSAPVGAEESTAPATP